MYKKRYKNFICQGSNHLKIFLVTTLCNKKSLRSTSRWREIIHRQSIQSEQNRIGKFCQYFFSGEFESIFVSKKSTKPQSCFSQDLCPQMASYSRLWAQYLFGHNKMAGVVGIEPTSKVLETPILPLNHTPIIEGKHPSIMVRQQGLEPRTDRLWAGCSNQLSYWRTNVSVF